MIPYVGYLAGSGDLKFNAAVAFLKYPGADEQIWGGDQADFVQYIGELHYGWTEVEAKPKIVFGLHYSDDAFASLGQQHRRFVEFSLRGPRDISFTTTVFNVDAEGGPGFPAIDYNAVSIGFSKSIGDVDISLSWHDTSDGFADLYGPKIGGDRAALTLKFN